MSGPRCTRTGLAAVLLAGAVAILAGSLWGARPAAAAFPGGSGSIAYECGTAPSDICVMNKDGSGQTQLTLGGLNLDPAWSSDGSKNTADLNAFYGVVGAVGVTDLGGNHGVDNGLTNCDIGGAACT
jgi:hypothetical protein